jgi:hypothetical protein
MARIRTIKPEFPQSESMGRVSRDARLLFVQMWTIADDEGRLRGNSRMLASLLFPYDNDAPGLIDGWLTELEREGCIIRYIVENHAYKQNYCQISNWLIHQKIDKPSASKIPKFDESSRILANPRECSLLDQGSRIMDQGSRIKEWIEDRGSRIEETQPSVAVCAPVPSTEAPRQNVTKAKPEAKTASTWASYADAYGKRYAVAPVRNAKVNGQVAQLVQRLGEDEAPAVAAFYVGHSNAAYVRAGHAIGCLLRDAEKLRTEWATGRRVTQTQAIHADRTQANGDVWGKLIAEAQAAR